MASVTSLVSKAFWTPFYHLAIKIARFSRSLFCGFGLLRKKGQCYKISGIILKVLRSHHFFSTRKVFCPAATLSTVTVFLLIFLRRTLMCQLNHDRKETKCMILAEKQDDQDICLDWRTDIFLFGPASTSLAFSVTEFSLYVKTAALALQ